MNIVIRTLLAGALAVSAAGAGNALAATSRGDTVVIDGGHTQSPVWRGSNQISHGTAFQLFGSDPLGLMLDPLATQPVVPYRATPQRPLAATGSATLEFHPNGEGVEVDGPTDIVYSTDGQYVLVPATGKSPLPGTANLSVHNAADMSLVRVIPLTHAPERMAVMSSQPRAVLLNPTDDTVTVVDYMAGIELAVIPVDGRPRALAISPDDTTAVVQGADNSLAGGESSWSVIDLSSNTETARLPGPDPAGTDAPGYFGHVWAVKMPVFLPGGDKVAALKVQDTDNGTALSVAVLNLSTLAWASIPIAPAQDLTFGSLEATPDGSTLVVPYAIFNKMGMNDVRVSVIDSESFATDDHFVDEVPSFYALEALIKPDGSKVAVNGFAALKILDTASGTVATADVSDFPYDYGWSAVANLADGDNFLAWYWGAGELGYQIFDWNGARLSELIDTDLSGNEHDVFTQLFAVSPIDDSHLAFVDPNLVGEDLVLLDLDPSNPQVLVHQQIGDGGIEGDGAIKLMVSTDQNTALVLNYQSSNAAFVDLGTMTNTHWIDTPKYATDAALMPDGNTAIFIAGAPHLYLPPPVANAGRMVFVDRGTGGTTDIPLPSGSYGRALAIDSNGDYGYTLLATPGVNATELVRVDLATRQLDGTRLPIPGGLTYIPSFGGFFSDVVTLPAALNESSRWAAQSHDGNLLAVASNPDEGTVTLIDKATWSVLTSVSLAPGGYDQVAMTFSSDDSRLYVIGQATISVIDIDGAESALIWQEPEDALARNVTLSPDDTKLYVGVWPVRPFAEYHNLRVFDTTTLETVTTIALPIQNDLGLPASIGRKINGPVSFQWTEDGSRLYVFSLNDEVHVIDTATNLVLESFTTGFLAPSNVVALANPTPGVSERRFLMNSLSPNNDGLAVLTIDEGGGDVIFESGFEQD